VYHGFGFGKPGTTSDGRSQSIPASDHFIELRVQLALEFWQRGELKNMSPDIIDVWGNERKSGEKHRENIRET